MIDPAGERSSPGNEPDRGERDELRCAAALARACWDTRYPGAVADTTIRSSLEVLVQALSQAPGVPLDPALREPPSLLSVRTALLDLMRREYLRGGVEGRVTEAPGRLRRLVRFEEVREGLEPDWNEQVDAALSGPQAQEMLAEIGHDLRSPLTSVLFLSDVLREAPGIREDEHQGRQLSLIYSGALTMLNIVNNFMELVRSGGSGADGHATVFSVQELFESTRRTVQPMADEKGLSLQISVKLERPDRRIGHPVSLSRILLNLATNALKFTESGGVRLEATEPAPGIVELAVVDTGPGINAAREKAIFNVFEPAQDRHGIRFSGTGLGLVIVRRLLNALGSELVCDSTVGEGTRMSFRLEMDLPDPPGVRSPDAEWVRVRRSS